MDIYPPDGVAGVVDIGKAQTALGQTGAITSESARRAHVAEITAATLLDIARSLRVLAYEAELALPPTVSGETIAEVEATEDDFFVEGDLVTVEGSTEPGEIRGFGTDQDETYATVVFANGEERRVWLSTLSRLRGDERLEAALAAETVIETLIEPVIVDGQAVGTRDVAAELTLNEDGSGSVREIDETDIDDDFEPASALDTLKASEAARKGKKKGPKK